MSGAVAGIGRSSSSSSNGRVREIAAGRMDGRPMGNPMGSARLPLPLTPLRSALPSPAENATSRTEAAREKRKEKKPKRKQTVAKAPSVQSARSSASVSNHSLTLNLDATAATDNHDLAIAVHLFSRPYLKRLQRSAETSETPNKEGPN